MLQLEEEEKEDKFDLNISVTNPEKVGKSPLEFLMADLKGSYFGQNIFITV